MMKLLTVVVFCTWLGLLDAQIVNIENRRIYDDTAGWSGAIDGGFSAVQNDKLLYSYNFRPKVQYKNRKHYYLLVSDLTYARGNKTTYSNSGMSHFRYAYRIKNSPWKWESYTQVQYNQLLNQKIRALVGTGLRWKFYDNKKYRFFVGSSTFYEYEEYRTENVFHNDLRFSNYLSWYLDPGKGYYFTAVTYYQPLWANFDDFRFSGQYTLGFNVFKRVDVRMEYNLFYDSRPPDGVRKMVFSTSAGVHVKLGQ